MPKDQNGRRPNWKMTKMEDDTNRKHVIGGIYHSAVVQSNLIQVFCLVKTVQKKILPDCDKKSQNIILINLYERSTWSKDQIDQSIILTKRSN